MRANSRSAPSVFPRVRRAPPDITADTTSSLPSRAAAWDSSALTPIPPAGSSSSSASAK
ncbi:hypothetical protein CORC01_04234 [Colletotrichum orchidophilum]|uniref:Uncharacterized protein n=1 Tax=Colletotrichum orchidophilum TaxID=1209926 RepID=A0A1G4BGH4_9PEZI|nr:uncharacterized protein CORC01_04234 [Colletotrichum orchidophilum]OHF00484.1 hypothetical protein CORC01_04234 [Colletotrichum orchidophilum]